MRALLISASAIILLSFATDFATSADTTQKPTTRKWHKAAAPNKGGYDTQNKNNIAFRSSKNNNGEGTFDRNSQQSQIGADGKTYKAGRQGQAETVQGTGAQGKTAIADQSKRNKDNGHRSAEYNGNKGNRHVNLNNKKQGNENNWNGDTKSGKNIQTKMTGNKQKFDAKGSKGNTYNLTPSKQDKQSGQGTITRNGEKYNYQEEKQSNGDTKAKLSNVGRGPNRRTYTCQGQKQGVSYCVDDSGKKFGEVVAQPDKTVIVKKTIAKGVDVPVGKAKVTKNQNGKSVATITDGLYQCEAGNYKERDCMSDYGKKASKMKIEKPITVKWSSEKNEGTRRTFQFPDCVIVSAKITLPPGMDIRRLAVQVDASILPAGKLKCIDAGSCRKDCYYCNLCNNTRKATVTANSDPSNVCSAKGGGTYQLSITLCPPPEDFNKAMCSGFTKGDVSYWKKKGDCQVKLIFWERPVNEEEIRIKYYNEVSKNSIQRNVLLARFRIEKIQTGQFTGGNPTDYDLCEFYIEKNAKPAEVVGCVEGTVNYTMSSKKVSTTFLLDGGTTVLQGKNAFVEKPCPTVDKINEEQSKQYAAEAAASKSSKPSNPWGFNFGNWGGG